MRECCWDIRDRGTWGGVGEKKLQRFRAKNAVMLCAASWYQQGLCVELHDAEVWLLLL